MSFRSTSMQEVGEVYCRKDRCELWADNKTGCGFKNTREIILDK